MPRLNIKSTKAAFVKELKKLEDRIKAGKLVLLNKIAQDSLLDVARELEIDIKPEEYN